MAEPTWDCVCGFWSIEKTKLDRHQKFCGENKKIEEQLDLEDLQLER